MRGERKVLLLYAIFGYPTINDEAINEALESLKNKREVKAVKMRFGLGCRVHTLKEVAQKLKVSAERTRQIEAKALRKLRHPDRSRELRKWLLTYEE